MARDHTENDPWWNPDLEVLDWAAPDWYQHLQREFPASLLTWSEALPLTARVRFGEENVLFDPADCVLVRHDGHGGGWVLQGRENPVVRRFCGRTHTLGPPLPRRALLTLYTSDPEENR